MKITNNILTILQKQDKTMYWLAQETKMKYQSIHNLANNKTESIKFENMANICKALNCTPNELFNICD